jgi:adenylate kinase
VTETLESLANKFKQAVQQSHSEEYKGPTEKGLRMLVFGKPGSGKVSYLTSIGSRS